jgi:hypothetical protein
VRLRRGRFAEVISRQLELFAEDEAALIEECRERELAYGRTGRDDAEEAYGDYMDAVDAAVDALAEMRDRFATTLPEAAADAYVDEFNRAIRRRWAPFGPEIERR